MRQEKAHVFTCTTSREITQRNPTTAETTKSSFYCMTKKTTNQPCILTEDQISILVHFKFLRVQVEAQEIFKLTGP